MITPITKKRNQLFIEDETTNYHFMLRYMAAITAITAVATTIALATAIVISAPGAATTATSLLAASALTNTTTAGISASALTTTVAATPILLAMIGAFVLLIGLVTLMVALCGCDPNGGVYDPAPIYEPGPQVVVHNPARYRQSWFPQPPIIVPNPVPPVPVHHYHGGYGHFEAPHHHQHQHAHANHHAHVHHHGGPGHGGHGHGHH